MYESFNPPAVATDDASPPSLKRVRVNRKVALSIAYDKG